MCEQEGILASFDGIIDGMIRRLAPGVDEDSLEQASLAEKVGGLGMRGASVTALPATIASKIMAAPKVAIMDRAFATAGLMEGQLAKVSSMPL